MTLRPLIAACILAATAVGSAAAQQIDRAVIAATAPLNDSQKAALQSFAETHVRAIKASAGPSLADARMALVSPLRDPAATVNFRKGMAQLLVDELGPVAKGADLQRAINAMQVLRFTRTPEALDVILDRANPSAETDAGKRVSASGLLADAFEDLDANNAYIEIVARKLRDSPTAETDWGALQQKLMAIGAAARRGDLNPESVRRIRLVGAEAIAAVAKSMAASKQPDARMQAIARVLVGARNDLLTLKEADRTAIAKTMAPALVDFLNAASAQWDGAHADATMSAVYGSTMNSSEVLLRLIDRGVRTAAYGGSKPESDSRIVAPAWEAKDKAKFDAEAKRWAGVVSAPPYK
ncbi:MAG: hypothetical protein ACO3IB_00755 [Phycisphaerales bacterium]